MDIAPLAVPKIIKISQCLHLHLFSSKKEYNKVTKEQDNKEYGSNSCPL